MDDDDDEEEWRPVPGISEDKILVSSYGRYRIRLKANSKMTPPLTGTPKKSGYVAVCLNGKIHYLHRLVCMAFHGLCPQGHTCDHVNKIRHDNRSKNLRWASSAQQRSNQRAIKKPPRTRKAVFVRHQDWPSSVPWRRFGSGLEAYKTWKINNVVTALKRNGRVGEWFIQRTLCQNNLDDEVWVQVDTRTRVSNMGRAQTKDNLGEGWSAKFFPTATQDRSYATINGHKSFHRVVFFAFGGTLREGETVDHINGDTSDNKFCNLRAATYSEQAHNKQTPKTNRHSTAVLARLSRAPQSQWEFFPSISEASKLLSERTSLKFFAGSIHHVLAGNRAEHRGYHFRHAV